MEYLDGVRLVDGIKEQYIKYEKIIGKSLKDIENERKEQIKNGTFIYKTLDEQLNQKKKIDFYYNLYDNFLTLNPLRFAYNISIFRLFTGPIQYKISEKPINLAEIILLLADVSGHQIFVDGVFNCDSHPGNILLMKDGKLGLIDMGQVKRMDLKERINYAKLIIAHAELNKDEVVRLHFDVLKVKTKYYDKNVAYMYSAFYNDRNTSDITQGKNISSFIDFVQELDPIVELPEQYILVGRANLILRGIGNAFGLQLSVANLWKKYANDLLSKYNEGTL